MLGEEDPYSASYLANIIYHNETFQLNENYVKLCDSANLFLCKKMIAPKV